MNGGLEQGFIDLEEMLADDNFHSEAEIIEFIHEKLSSGFKLNLIIGDNGHHTIVEDSLPIAQEENDSPVYRDDDEVVLPNVHTSETSHPITIEFRPLPKGIEKVVIYKMDYDVFQDLVTEEFGVPYSFLAATESGNDVSHEFTVSKNEDEGQEEVRKEIQAKVDRVKELIAKSTKTYSAYELDYCASDMLDYLCTKGIIPEGNYIIRVSY